MTAWLPIDTAPLEYESIILWDGRDSFEGFFDKSLGRWACANEVRCVPPPTHWMPLPLGPEAATDA